MSRTAFRLALALVLGGLAMAAPAPLAAQQPAEAELRESQRRLQEVRGERESLRAEMDLIRGRVHDLAAEVGNLAQQLDASAAVLRELEFQVAEREAQIEQIRLDLATTHESLAAHRKTLNRRLRAIYKRGPLHAADVLIGADSFSDLINRYRYLLLIARHDRLLVDEVRDLESQLVSRERALRTRLLQLSSVRDQRSAEYGALTALEREQQRALETARTDESAAARRIADLAEDERRLADLLATLDRGRRAAESRPAAPTAPGSAAPAATLSPALRGTLPWPVDGTVLYRFGGAPEAGASPIRWSGLGIGAATGTDVHGVAAGTVVVAGRLEGYGPSVVVSHGGGYYSLYLYLREVSVAEGARVERGQLLGTVGGQATPEGAHVEFQIRGPGGQPVDPEPWLQPRGG